MNSVVYPESHICPVCGTTNEFDTLIKREYRCIQCNLELAHLDVASNGVIRGIFGWLHDVGSIIEDRYRVLSVLGKGGFGATYLVEDLRLSGKRRAIKEVPELLFDEYETSLLSRLNHPAIPDIIDRNVADGMVYLVLEFGGNKTLGSERKHYQGCIPLATLMPWMRQLCEVLIYLHSQNPPIIHRDLKPDNILLDENGRIMLIDFGIAKEATPATMTRTIGRAATHGFSPPEQAMGTGTDERSDIYALSATFYALLTGENPPAAHERVAGKELVPPSQLVPEISPLLESALLRGLNLNVNLRQQTVKEFSLALEAIDVELSGSATHSDQYADRTVMISKRTSATGLHPHSLKLPSGRITTSTSSAPSSDTTLSQQTSKRNALILMTGIMVIIAVLLTLTYLFWPKAITEPKQTAEPPVAKESEDLKSVSESKAANETTGEAQIESTPTLKAPEVGTSIKGETVKELLPSKTDSSSALQELEKRWKQQDEPEQLPKAESMDSAHQIIEEEAKKQREAERRAEEKAKKQREAKRRSEETAKKRLEAKRDEDLRRAAQAAKPNGANPPPQEDWLKDFSGSQIRRK